MRRVGVEGSVFTDGCKRGCLLKEKKKENGKSDKFSCG